MTRSKNGSKLYKVLSRLAPEEMKVKSSKFSNTKTPPLHDNTFIVHRSYMCYRQQKQKNLTGKMWTGFARIYPLNLVRLCEMCVRRLHVESPIL